MSVCVFRQNSRCYGGKKSLTLKMKSKWLAASAGHLCMLCTFFPLPVCRLFVYASVRPYVSKSVHLYFWLSPIRPKMYSCVSTGPLHFSNLLMYTCCRSQLDFQLFTWWPIHTHKHLWPYYIGEERLITFSTKMIVCTVGCVSSWTRVGEQELRKYWNQISFFLFSEHLHCFI